MRFLGLALLLVGAGCSKQPPFGFDSVLATSATNPRPVDSYTLTWPAEGKVRLEVQTEAFDGWLDAPELAEMTRKIEGKKYIVEGKVSPARSYRVTVAAASAGQTGSYRFFSAPQPATIAYASAASAAAPVASAPPPAIAPPPAAARRRNEGRSQRAADLADSERRKAEHCNKCKREREECRDRGHSGCSDSYGACVRQWYNMSDCGY